MWDVAVVGGGPAGSAAALAVLQAAPGARVIVLDAGGPGRDKTCGDAVAAETFDLAADLGVPDLGAGHPPVTRLRVVGPAGRSVVHPPARPARIIPRRLLDDRLPAPPGRPGPPASTTGSAPSSPASAWSSPSAGGRRRGPES